MSGVAAGDASTRKQGASLTAIPETTERALFHADGGGAETKHGTVLTATGHFA